jgi:hypothetical protein|tara:strand:+ start:323 stop:826 length:504 start_codon:yes stop_codon:yes gene_type:complete
MKSQGNSRFRGRNNNYFDSNGQGGFQAGFVNHSQNLDNYKQMKQSKSLGRNTGMKTVLSMGGDMLSETHADTNDMFQRTQSRLSAKTTKNNIPVQAMMEDQMKLYFNKARPKYGIKNYHIVDNMNKEPYFKIQKIAFTKGSDKPKDHFLDAHCKIHGPKPAPGKYNM